VVAVGVGFLALGEPLLGRPRFLGVAEAVVTAGRRFLAGSGVFFEATAGFLLCSSLKDGRILEILVRIR